MIQVYLICQPSPVTGATTATQRVPLGPEVETLQEARIIVKVYDHLLETQNLPPHELWYTTDTEICAVDSNTGERWDYMDQDPSGNSDGIWVDG